MDIIKKIFGTNADKDTISKSIDCRNGTTSSMEFKMPNGTNLENIRPYEYMTYNRGYVYAANHKISSSLASLPYHLYTTCESSQVSKMIDAIALNGLIQKSVASSASVKLQDQKELVQIMEHPILDLLKNPYVGWSQTEWFYVISTYLGLIGNAYLVKHVDSAGQLTGLEPLMSELVRIEYNRKGVITRYHYEPMIRSYSIDPVSYTPDQIVHIKNRVAGSIMQGTGNLQACLQMFDVANHAEKYARDLLKNGAMPGYAVICEDDSRLPLNDKGEIDEKKMEELENKWTYKWTKKLGGVRFGFGKVKIEKINLTMADSQVDKFLMESKKQICACFSVPLSCLDETDSNKATALASMKQLKMFGVFPKMALILDQLNAVFNEYFDKSYFVWVDQREAMETDQLELAQVLSILKNAGILSTNDCRKKLDETTLDGDLYNKPVSAQASVAVQGQAAGTTPAGTNQ